MRNTSALVIGILLSASAAAHATNGDTTTEGRLVTREHGKTIDVPLAHTDVHIRVDGFLADATVTQHFRNPYPTKIEAVYLFPLPDDAAVTELTITNGTHVIHGTIQPRAAAKQIYEAARSKGLVAALLTEERPNLFTQSIANLEPAAEIDVTLRYVERLPYADGGYELVFPMVVGPRYLPAAAKDTTIQAPVLPPGVRSSHDISLSVELDAGVPIEGVSSPSHQLALVRPGPSRASIQLAPGDTIPNKDFVLRYRVAGEVPRFGVLGYRDGGEGSFLLVAQPPVAPAADAITPRELVFVLDTSSSMRGAPLAKAKQVIGDALRKLRPDDTFQIVRFADHASALGAAPIANKPQNVALTFDWLAKLDANGGTEMTTGIAAALAVPHDPARLRIVAFLTDGYVGNEDEVLATVSAKLGAARLFSFGVGSAVNRYLLDELAVVGRGDAQYVRPDEDTARAVAAFVRRIDAPVLTDLRVDWGGLAVRDATPNALPDLFAGQPLVVSGHYDRGGTATVTVHGMLGGRAVTFDVPVTLPERDVARPAIATVWARQRITELSRRLIRRADPAVVKQVTELALAQHLLTPYTAFVAVDATRVTSGGTATTVAVPVEVPDRIAEANGGSFGVSGYGIGGGMLGVVSGGSYGTIARGEIIAAGRSAGMLSRVATPLMVIVDGQPVSVGSLDTNMIRRYLRRRFEAIHECYQHALVARPTLFGVVTAHFTIAADGHVVSGTVDGIDDSALTSCIAGVISEIKFPVVPDGGLVQVNYPFTLQPPKPDPQWSKDESDAVMNLIERQP